MHTNTHKWRSAKETDIQKETAMMISMSHCQFVCAYVLTLDVLVIYWFPLLKLNLSGFALLGNKMSTFRSYSWSLALTQYSATAWYTIMVAWREKE